MKKTISKKMKKVFIITTLLLTTISFAQKKDYPSLTDSNFKELASDFEFDTYFHFLIQEKSINQTDFWIRIDLPDVKVPNSKGTIVDKTGGYELVEYAIDCENQIIEEKRRIQFNEYGDIQNVLFQYFSYQNKTKIIKGTYFDVLRVNVCE
ncbi:hypothetical protein [Gelidibacter maritimus]|uniref:Uncharacterized protein n=1 Tax=Gelidibacter maritimus TaxID=2761487 RepID=A0A7W2M8U3_9FLAO|nr:hypothetical protein [Gelidibacter maritimus]MBA6154869.1 hypothetical protein [Gelidibacter maritimus]